jgi:hypothetical protein
MRRLALISLFLATRLLADGGAVQLREESGPFAITVFASPAPLRAGPADLSVLVQDRESLRAVLDAGVTLHLSHGDSEFTLNATHGQAQNKLLYATVVNLPEAGEWKYSVTVEHGSARTAVSGSATVAATQAGMSTHWVAIGIAPLCILIFGFHQFLSGRARRPC